MKKNLLKISVIVFVQFLIGLNCFHVWKSIQLCNQLAAAKVQLSDYSAKKKKASEIVVKALEDKDFLNGMSKEDLVVWGYCLAQSATDEPRYMQTGMLKENRVDSVSASVPLIYSFGGEYGTMYTVVTGIQFNAQGGDTTMYFPAYAVYEGHQGGGAIRYSNLTPEANIETLIGGMWVNTVSSDGVKLGTYTPLVLGAYRWHLTH